MFVLSPHVNPRVHSGGGVAVDLPLALLPFFLRLKGKMGHRAVAVSGSVTGVGFFFVLTAFLRADSACPLFSSLRVMGDNGRHELVSSLRSVFHPPFCVTAGPRFLLFRRGRV